MSGRIRTTDMDTLRSAGVGPGAVLVNCEDLTPEGFLKVLRNDPTAQGRHIGGMTAAPSFSDSDETVDRTENLVGVNVDMIGAHHIQRTTVTLTVEIAKMSVENFTLIRPDYEITDWTTGGATPQVVGKRLRRTGIIRPDMYFKNAVLILPIPESTTGFAFVVENAMNRADDAEHQPEDDGNVYGVSTEFRGHSDASQMDLETGNPTVPYEILVLDLPETVTP